MYLYSDCPLYFEEKNQHLKKLTSSINTNINSKLTTLEESNREKTKFLDSYYALTTNTHRYNPSLDSNKPGIFISTVESSRKDLPRTRNKLSDFQNSALKSKISLKKAKASEELIRTEECIMESNNDLLRTKSSLHDLKNELETNRTKLPEKRNSILSLQDKRKLPELFSNAEKKEENAIIKSVFSKNLINTLKTQSSKGFDNFVDEAMFQLKKRVYFMKGAVDYIYPKMINYKYSKKLAIPTKEAFTEAGSEVNSSFFNKSQSSKELQKERQFYIKAKKKIHLRSFGACFKKVKPVKVYCPMIVQSFKK